jgi:hypothetical protein
MQGEWTEPLGLLIAIVIPSGLIAMLLLALMGQERRRLQLILEYYRQIKLNADKERRMAEKGEHVTRKIRALEAQAIALLKHENILREVKRPPAEPTPPPPS